MPDPYRAPVLVDADPLPNTCVPGGAVLPVRCPATPRRPLMVELRALPPGLTKAFTASATLLLLVASASLSALTWTVAHASALRDAEAAERREAAQVQVQQVQQASPLPAPRVLPPRPAPRVATPWDRPALLAALGADTHEPDELWARAVRLAAAGFDIAVHRREMSRDELSRALDRGGYAHIAHEQREEGTPGGLRVLEVAPGSVLGRAGLRSGDLITAVNGHALARPEDVVRAHDRLTERGAAVVELIREGRPVALRIDWR